MTVAAVKTICEDLGRLQQELDEAAADYAAQERRLQVIPHGRYSTAELHRMEEIKKTWRAASLALEEHRMQHGCAQEARSNQQWRSA
jgi:hypothetical protein